MAHRTILFLDDWKRIAAKPHMQTGNKSFLKMAKAFRDMGIQNWYFHLALIDQRLVDIDPHDPNLTPEQRVWVLTEASVNYWYFVREVARVPAEGVGGKPYQASRSNIMLAWLYLCHIDQMLIQPRQTGKSVGVDFIWAWILWFAGRGVKVQLMTLNNRLRTENMARMRKIRDRFPKWMIKPNRFDAENSERMTYSGWSQPGKEVINEYAIFLPQADEEGANNVGRGLTSANKQFDEGPFCPNIDISIPASLNGTTAARDDAKAFNGFYGILYTTTAGDLGTKEGRYMYDILMSGTEWSEMFYDCKDQKELALTVRVNSRSGQAPVPFISAVFSHRQLGKDDQWLRETIAANKNTKASAEKDYLNKWGKGSEKSPLSVEVMDEIASSGVEPVWREITKEERCMFNWYIDKMTIAKNMTTTQYVIGVDTSDSTGKDATTFVMRDVRDGSVACVGTFNNISLPMITRAISNFLIQHKNSVLVVERNRAQHLIDQLLIDLPAKGVDPFKRMYNLVVEDQTVRVSDFRDLARTTMSTRDQSFYDAQRAMFGFWTGKDSREALYGGNFFDSAEKCSKSVRDMKLINELSQLITDKKGRINHPSGGHDDLVIAWLLGYWFMTRASHLSWYGIETGKVMLLAQSKGTESEEDVVYREQQIAYKEELNEIMEEIKNCESPLLVTRLEMKARKVRGYIDDTQDEIISIDQFINAAKEERAKRIRDTQQKRRNMGNNPFARQFGRRAA